MYVSGDARKRYNTQRRFVLWFQRAPWCCEGAAFYQLWHKSNLRFADLQLDLNCFYGKVGKTLCPDRCVASEVVLSVHNSAPIYGYCATTGSISSFPAESQPFKNIYVCVAVHNRIGINYDDNGLLVGIEWCHDNVTKKPKKGWFFLLPFSWPHWDSSCFSCDNKQNTILSISNETSILKDFKKGFTQLVISSHVTTAGVNYATPFRTPFTTSNDIDEDRDCQVRLSTLRLSGRETYHTHSKVFDKDPLKGSLDDKVQSIADEIKHA